MRILLVSPFPPSADGIGTYTQAIANSLEAAGHKVGVVLPRDQANLSDSVIGVVPGRWQQDTVSDAVYRWAPDLIHVQFAVSTFGAKIWALRSWLRSIRVATEAPIVITMHEVTRDTVALRSFGRSLYRSLAMESNHIIVHTRAAYSSLTESMGVPAERVSVIPHHEPDLPPIVTTSKELRDRFGLGDAEIFLVFGFIHVDKGLGDLVAALGLLGENTDFYRSGIRLVVAGSVRSRVGLFRLFELRDRWHLSSVLRQARRNGAECMIIQTGFVPDSDIAGWFQAASAVVLPYRRTEESGVASLASAFGVPVIASTAGGLGERYAKSPWIFSPKDVQGLATVIGEFRATAPDQRRIPSGISEQTKLKSVVSATINVYKAVAGSAISVP